MRDKESTVRSVVGEYNLTEVDVFDSTSRRLVPHAVFNLCFFVKMHTNFKKRLQSECRMFQHLYDASFCRYAGSSTPCFLCPDSTYRRDRVQIRRNPCSQCLVHIMKLRMTNFTAISCMTMGEIRIGRVLHYFLRSKELFREYFVCAAYIAELYAKDGDQNKSLPIMNQLQSMMYWVSRKRSAVGRFIELKNGKYFREFVIDLLRSPFEHRLNKGLNVAHYFIILHLNRHRGYYIRKALREQQRAVGVVRANYQWIHSYLTERPKIWLLMDQISKLRIILSGKRYIVCDNRECDKEYEKNKEIEFKRCKRCRMTFYCSKRCQKVDWNKYNHRKICFYY